MVTCGSDSYGVPVLSTWRTLAPGADTPFAPGKSPKRLSNV